MKAKDDPTQPSVKARRPGRPNQPVDKSEIIKKALDAFAEGGYAGTSMSNIAERVGLRKASLFHHFPTKGELYLEVLQSIINDFAQTLVKAERTKGTFNERLDILLDAIITYLGTQKNATRVWVREMMGEGAMPGSNPIHKAFLFIMERMVLFFQSGDQSNNIEVDTFRHLAISTIAINVCYFACCPVMNQFFDKDILTSRMLEERKRIVKEQVRSLCLTVNLPNMG